FTASGNFGGKAAAVSMLISGCYLGSGEAAELNVVKLRTKPDKKAIAFKKAKSAADYKDGYYAIFDEKTKQLVTEATFDSDTNYILTLFIKDNGEYDIDGAEGKIAAPTVLYATAYTPVTPEHQGSSGCNAGFAALTLLALLPLAAKAGKKK
ncbi:MAG: Synerg-CTERM sorting domain-containing protein, partial [Synergistaceae bacterium]